MGGSDTDTKKPKASAAQEQPEATSSSASAVLYLDWSGFQGYPSVPPPSFFNSPVVSSPQTHPYVWGPQHLMPSYGTQPAPYMMYPHGIYAHPSIPLGTHTFNPFAIASTNGNAKVCVSVPYNTGDTKSSDGKERNPIQRSKGTLGSLNMITGKGNYEIDKTSGAANGVFSHIGSEDSSEGTDANSHSESEPDSELKTSSRQEHRDETSRNGTSGSDTAPTWAASHPTIPLMSMIATGIPGVVAGPTTNLNIGMDYWVAPTTTAILPLSSKDPAAATDPTIPGAHGGASEKDERELKRQRRKQSNRESARRSRLRKQAEYEELAQRVEVLEEENDALRAELDNIKNEHHTLLSQNDSLKARVEGKTTEELFAIEDSNQHAKNNGKKNLNSGPQAGQSDTKITNSSYKFSEA